MKAPPKPIAVQEIPGESLRFHVASLSGNTPYLVDLEEYGGNGKCGCQDFEFRKEPELARGAAPSDRLRCAHIRVARAFFCDLKIAELSEVPF